MTAVEGGEELVLDRGGVALDGGGHAAHDVVEGGVVGVGLLQGDEDRPQRVVVGLAPVGQLHAAGDDVAQRRVEDLELGGGVGGELVDDAVGQREAVGARRVLRGRRAAAITWWSWAITVCRDDSVRSGGMGGAPFTRGGARWPTG